MLKALLILFMTLLPPLSAQAILNERLVLKIEQRILSLYKNHKVNNHAKIIFLNSLEAKETNAFARWIPQINTRFININISKSHTKQLSSDILVFFICHEFGHFFGGKPFINKYFPLSVEGQSDYFAAQDCKKR